MPQTIAITTRAVLVLLVTALLPAACGLNGPAAAAEESRSVYDLEQIYQRPLEVETTDTKVIEGIRVEYLRFSARDADGQKFRFSSIRTAGQEMTATNLSGYLNTEEICSNAPLWLTPDPFGMALN